MKISLIEHQINAISIWNLVSVSSSDFVSYIILMNYLNIPKISLLKYITCVEHLGGFIVSNQNTNYSQITKEIYIFSKKYESFI